MLKDSNLQSVPPKSPDADQVLRNTIDSRIALLNVEIKNLSAQRNTVAPIIQKLPRELLATVFLYLRQMHLEAQFRTVGESHEQFLANTSARSGLITPIGDDFRWAKGCTQVCSYWRSIALESPALWSSISELCKPEVVKSLLLRSKSHPLVVLWTRRGFKRSIRSFFTGRERPAQEVLEERVTTNTLLKELSRMRTLVVVDSHYERKDALLLEVLEENCSAPLLEFLQLDIGLTELPRIVPPKLVELMVSGSPRLRILELRSHSLAPFKSLNAPGVTCLTLITCSPVYYADKLDVLGILRGLKQLTSLVLSHGYIDNQSMTREEDALPVEVPYLRVLSMTSTHASEAIFILSRIKPSNPINVHFKIIDGSGLDTEGLVPPSNEAESLYQLIEALTRFHTLHTLPHRKKIVGLEYMFSDFSLRFHVYGNPITALSSKYALADAYDWWGDRCLELLSTVPLADIEDIALCSKNALSTEVCLKHLHDAPRVTNLDIDGMEDPRAIIDLLKPDNDNKHIMYSKLRTIKLSNLDGGPHVDSFWLPLTHMVIDREALSSVKMQIEWQAGDDDDMVAMKTLENSMNALVGRTFLSINDRYQNLYCKMDPPTPIDDNEFTWE